MLDMQMSSIFFYLPLSSSSLLPSFGGAGGGFNPSILQPFNHSSFISKCKGKNEKCSTRSVNKQINVYLAIARKKYPELPEHIHSHQFRHSMATHMIDDGINVFNVSKFLGHKSVSTTMKYIGITPKMTEKAIAQIESSSLHHISAKWKKTASLVDLIK